VILPVNTLIITGKKHALDANNMSNKQTDIWLEQMEENFFYTDSLPEKLAILELLARMGYRKEGENIYSKFKRRVEKRKLEKLMNW